MPHTAVVDPVGTSLPGPARWLGFAGLAAGLALIVLDGTVVAVALPSIIDDLDLGLADAQWINSLYAVVFAALLLTSGRLGDRFGRRLVFLIGVSVFAMASLTAAGAQDAGELIASRCVQGLGGALILPATVSSLNATFRGRDRSLAFGLWGAVMAGAAAVGPLLGGWLTTAFGWRWVFLVNLPLALVVVGLAAGFVTETRGEAGHGFDLGGLVTSGLGLGLVVFGLIEGPDLGWLTPKNEFTLLGLTWPDTAPVSPVPVALVAGAVLTGLFLVLQRHRSSRGRTVILDLSLFAVPTFAWGNLAAAMVAVGEFSLLFGLPLYLVYAMKLSILEAGWVLAAMAIGAFVAGARARSLSARLGAPRVVTVGLAAELVAAVVAALVLPSQPDAWLIAALLAVYGLGLGLASAQLTSTVLRDVPVELSGVASATQSTVRQLGSALGAALAGTVLALGFAVTVPARLALVADVSNDDANTMIDYMTGTAGAVISMIRKKGTHGYFGELGPAVADQLSVAFAQCVGWVLWVAAAFILLGLVGALAVERAAHRTPQD
ncbi:MAG: MFS transporter [Actinobacteria bacterium]|nr:MFS transporter [Actinomycetota bacterium]